MATFVLVHGAWSGAHGFRHVRRLLTASGHVVFTPSLTGIGERAHLTSPQVSLSTHVADVTNVILYEDLVDVVLVGFSYGGVVVTGCLEHVADRVAHLGVPRRLRPQRVGDSVERLAGRDGDRTDRRRRPLVGPRAVPPLRRPGRRGVHGRPAQRASASVLHRTGPAARSARGVPVLADVYPGHR